MTQRVLFDGLNLALDKGTGVATYTRVLAHLVRELGFETGVIYNLKAKPPKNALRREIFFFDDVHGRGPSRL